MNNWLRPKDLARKCFQALLASVLGIGGASSYAAPLDDLSGGQTGRIEFNSKTPDHRWALVRGRLGSDTPIFGDLLMPANAQGKVPAVVFSHGSEGVSSLYFDVWAKALNAAGYAVFVVDSFKPRNEERVTGASKQLTWNTTANLADALYSLKLLATHPQIDSQHIYHMGWSRGGQAVLDAAWPTYQQHVVPVTVKWAGSIAVYPGCNMRYRVDQHNKLPSPLLMLLGEKDDISRAWSLPMSWWPTAIRSRTRSTRALRMFSTDSTRSGLSTEKATTTSAQWTCACHTVPMIVLGVRYMTSTPARPSPTRTSGTAFSRHASKHRSSTSRATTRLGSKLSRTCWYSCRRAR
ncbi:dienelactone hydrolase family protein [Comamonas sp. Y6]|uniref:Dienelactone hydrolase family protein n=1 Tax=Comamonas resistens TaxID=3046670 RepID=A0ABY8SL00_9BURK|nr:dienelactone hydrolase family protein [Comamonas resistens]MDL5039091.1 dienelactone hydrolase family protein [Comamonas resistens]WHS63762.1 dienelactone hydrolase family protein [Comamonas resistens]